MELKEIAKLVRGSRRIAIMGHKGGDADCYGASFGLAAALETLGKDVKIITGEDYPQSLVFLFFYFTGELTREIENPDLLILVDTSDLGKLSDPTLAEMIKESGTKVVQIDHHTRGDLSTFADSSYTNTKACSASEIVYHLLIELGVDINKNIATCLLTGIISDTSSFQNQNTTEQCFAVASELMKKGARLQTIINHTFGGREVDALKVWGLAMERLTIDKNSGIVFTYLTHSDITNFGLSPDIVSGIINYLNSIKGAKFVLLIAEEEEGMIKVSMRTRDEFMDVAKLARQLGGGGHIKAAGFSFPGSLKILTDGNKSHIVIT